ncbi:ABC transporter ATP-binding protein [Haploplasma axanthum]|uniref:ABC-type multidrug/protein/lipid transport system ATPase component n=1 Tax=Haploplasma axanthum TaxID=29552 RepID=A0A449BCN2_HAPAX|nr:ABC transporter ATP-binding protein [Haploplasma axanthum]VEU80192.1 ABC-type multidrug/protein/lipid transport system ATPase component [Haploplasma axanthum]
MRKLLKYIKIYKWHFIISIFLIIVVAGLVSYAPVLEGSIITSFQKSIDNKSGFDKVFVTRTVITLISVYTFVAICRLTFNQLLTIAIQKTMKKIRNDVQQKIHRMPIRYFDTHPIGDIMSRMSNDVESLSNGMQQAFASVFNAILTILFIITFMFVSVNWQFALLALAMFPIIFIISRFILKASGPLYAKRFKTYGVLAGHLQEQYTGYKEITLYNKQEDSAKMFDGIMVDLSKYVFRSDFVSGLLNPIISTVTYITIVIMALIGGKLAIEGTIVLGTLHAGIRYIWRLSSPITQVTQMSVVIQSSTAAAKRVFDFLDEDEEKPDYEPAEHIENLQGHVTFENVDFAYSKDKPILKNVSFDVKPGQMIAIVGPTGSGKTTIINLLMRFYDIDSGKIRLDGINLNHLKKDELRTHFGMVLQDTWLFHGTIADNIKYGRDDATMEEIIQAAKYANIHHYISTLPDGYNMVINEEGNNISQGEKQLLTIARAFLANPSMLILDEATSTVDTRLEVMLQEAMKNIMSGRTSFVIAHRLSTIKNADLIVVLKDGEIIEMGTHNELIAQKGFYENLYNSQFEND